MGTYSCKYNCVCVCRYTCTHVHMYVVDKGHDVPRALANFFAELGSLVGLEFTDIWLNSWPWDSVGQPVSADSAPGVQAHTTRTNIFKCVLG